MIRVLIVDGAAAAELTLRALESAGLACAGERVTTEREFREALARAPDLILSDPGFPGLAGIAALSITKSERPETPFIFISDQVRGASAADALAHGATGYIAKSDPTALAHAVRSALQPITVELRRARDRAEPGGTSPGISDTASFLLERRARVDRALQPQDGSSLSNILSDTPPTPAALIMISSASSRDRYVKLLNNARIETEVALDPSDATVRLANRIHALLFTDRLDLVKTARQLHAGSATHIVFVSAPEDANESEALRAGANDVMPEDARGEQFWAHLTTARRIVSFASSLQSAITDNRILSTIDELTRCGNRRYFEHQFPKEVARATRLQRPLSLLMCDIDYFKAINDQHGHQVGDQVLQEFGERIIQGLRLGEDWVARIGGEEFAIVLPETGRFEGFAIAQRLCDRVNATAFATSTGAIAVTASFGVCGHQGPAQDTMELAENMVICADAALYRSKRSGRNRVTDAVESDVVAHRKRRQQRPPRS